MAQLKRDDIVEMLRLLADMFERFPEEDFRGSATCDMTNQIVGLEAWGSLEPLELSSTGGQRGVLSVQWDTFRPLLPGEREVR